MELLFQESKATETLVVGSVTPEKHAQHDYSPLEQDHIRLIELLPGVKGSPIQCKIFNSSLDDTSQPYECLSYMWGSPLQPMSISMDGSSVKVGQNLGAALQAIRDEEKSRTVWIDALCINQEDVAERSSQVAIMGQIFQGATKVLIWLGEAANDSDILFDHIVKDDPPLSTWVGPLDQRHENAMLAFYRRPYWRRVWIIQEIYAASAIDLFCGYKCIEYFMFHSAYISFQFKMENLQKDGKTPPGCTNNPQSDFSKSPGCRILLNRGSESSRFGDFSILRLLELCAACKSECKLAHDRVFGLVGILKSSQSGIIIPDYSKPLPELYLDVLISIIVPDSAEDSHFISTWGYIGKDLIASTRIVQQLLEEPLWNIEANNFHPLGDICNSLQIEKMKNLHLDVWMEGVGVISKVGDALTPEEFLDEDGKLSSTSSGVYSVVDRRQIDRFMHALKELDPRDFCVTQEINTRYMKNVTDPIGYTFDPMEKHDMTHHMMSATSDRMNRPFKTRNGVTGFASAAIQKGDLLYGFMALAGLFYGSSLFLIIRPDSDPSMHSFTLIGRAIVFPVPEERFCDMRTQRRRGKFVDFNFKGDLYSEGVSLDEDQFEEITCFMDIITLFHLTK